nr:hypothetical protein B0A51_06789 [Rachicladosporium sp. CCFEE 5018]
MPTPIDRALQSKNLFLDFGALVTAVAAWGIWGQDMFPTSGNPEMWTENECRRWLGARGQTSTSEEDVEALRIRVRRAMDGGTK